MPTNIEFDAVRIASNEFITTLESDQLHAMEVLGRETDNTYKWFKPRNHPALEAFQKVIFEDLVGQVRDVQYAGNNRALGLVFQEDSNSRILINKNESSSSIIPILCAAALYR